MVTRRRSGQTGYSSDNPGQRRQYGQPGRQYRQPGQWQEDDYAPDYENAAYESGEGYDDEDVDYRQGQDAWDEEARFNRQRDFRDRTYGSYQGAEDAVDYDEYDDVGHEYQQERRQGNYNMSGREQDYDNSWEQSFDQGQSGYGNSRSRRGFGSRSYSGQQGGNDYQGHGRGNRGTVSRGMQGYQAGSRRYVGGSQAYGAGYQDSQWDQSSRRRQNPVEGYGYSQSGLQGGYGERLSRGRQQEYESVGQHEQESYRPSRRGFGSMSRQQNQQRGARGGQWPGNRSANTASGWNSGSQRSNVSMDRSAYGNQGYQGNQGWLGSGRSRADRRRSGRYEMV